MFTVTFAPINGKLCQPIGLKHTQYIPNTYRIHTQFWQHMKH